MEYFGFISYINGVTTPDSLTCVDYFFVRDDVPFHETIDSFIFRDRVTDYCPVALTIEVDGLLDGKYLKKLKKYVNYKGLRLDVGSIRVREANMIQLIRRK